MAAFASTIDVRHFDTRNVVTMERMFVGCGGITTLDLSPLDTSSVARIDELFCYCTSLRYVDMHGLDLRSVRSGCHCNRMGKLGSDAFSSLAVVDLTGAQLGEVFDCGRWKPEPTYLDGAHSLVLL